MKRPATMLAVFLLLAVTMLQAQDRATITTYRVMPKVGKDAALKKAITDHVTKYHTGNWRWRVFRVLSGPDEGGYQINEGPNSWTTLEGRKDISDEHQRDYETTVLPLVERSTPEMYLVYQRELSSDSLVGPLKKALLRRFYLKPGKAGRLINHVRTWKKVWEKLGMKVLVFQPFYSGEPQLIVGARLLNGWVDLEQPMGKRMSDTFDEIAGSGAFVRYVEDLDKYVDHIVDEMIELLPEASSK